MVVSLLALVLTAAVWSERADADTWPIITFDNAPSTHHVWRHVRDFRHGYDPSRATLVVQNGIGILDGEVGAVPGSGAAAFVKLETADRLPFPDVSKCSAIEITANASSNYAGYRVTIGNRKCGDTFACGHMARFIPPVGTVGVVRLAMSAFTDYWSEITGDPIATCEDNVEHCLDSETLRNMRVFAFWAEGAGGNVHLEIKSVNAVDCNIAV
eukprot:TRINITY_DN69573_c0_g1_i1.p1 TRINITY_DN69573_c0_g1~~TRINITY_DN69573_c0_g1_i1.p1  ORF type:complete len:213 (+),score=19.83 TRINITY_DN69573_c0_g1_i1:57-695(+)